MLSPWEVCLIYCQHTCWKTYDSEIIQFKPLIFTSFWETDDIPTTSLFCFPFISCDTTLSYSFIFPAFMIIRKKLNQETEFIFWCIFDTLTYAEWGSYVLWHRADPYHDPITVIDLRNKVFLTAQKLHCSCCQISFSTMFISLFLEAM